MSCKELNPSATASSLHRGGLRSLLSAGGWFFVWPFVVLFLVVSCVVLFLLCVCVCDLFLFLQGRAEGIYIFKPAAFPPAARRSRRRRPFTYDAYF